jgi:TolB protein
MKTTAQRWLVRLAIVPAAGRAWELTVRLANTGGKMAARAAHGRGSRRALVVWSFLAGVLVLAAAGCGGSPAGTASDASPSAVTAATSGAASPTSAAIAGPLLPGQIAFRRNFDDTQSTGAIFTSGTNGSGERQATHPPAATLDDEPSWSPDGTRLLFTRTAAIGTNNESQRLFSVSSDGTGPTPVSPDTPAGFGYNAGTFSPDGKHIAAGTYHGHVKGGEIQFSDIVVMDADGGHRQQVTKFPAYSGDAGGVAWSPDGKRLVFARSNAGTTKPDGGRALFIMDVDGRHQRQLTPWTVDAGGTPDWSSKTNLIAFRAVADEESGIGNFFTIHPDGTSMTQVTHFTDTVISHKVGFSPDGQWIVFAKETAPGNNDVFIAKVDGSDMRAVTNTPLADSAPDWGAPR